MLKVQSLKLNANTGQCFLPFQLSAFGFLL
jgi:hypothetical protein